MLRILVTAENLPCRTPFAEQLFAVHILVERLSMADSSAANKYYFSAGHNEQKNKKKSGQIKFSVVTMKQQIKLVLRHSLCK